MPNLSLGTIEVLGLPAAVEAADVALKTADVTLIGYETTDGMGMVAVKIEGQVSAVQSAIHAACAAASKITKVFATSVIPRPADQLDTVVYTDVTVGLETPKPAPEPAVAEPEPTQPEPTVAEPEPEPTVVEHVQAPEPAVAEPVEAASAVVASPADSEGAPAGGNGQGPKPPSPAAKKTPAPRRGAAGTRTSKK